MRDGLSRGVDERVEQRSVLLSCGREWRIWRRKKVNSRWATSLDSERTYRLMRANAEKHARVQNAKLEKEEV